MSDSAPVETASSTPELPSLDQILSQVTAKVPEMTPETIPPPVQDTETASADAPAEVAASSPAASPGSEVASSGSESKTDESAPTSTAAAAFAAVSRREKAFRDQKAQAERTQRETETRLKQMEDSINSRLKQVEEREQKISSAKRPLDVLKAHGFSYDDASQDVIGGYKPADPDPMEERLKPLQERLSKVEELERQLKEFQDQRAQEQASRNLSQVMSNIDSVINKNPEKYEYVTTMGDTARELIKDTMVEYYQVHGSYLSYEEAADRVEDYYESEIVSKLTATKKVQSRFSQSTTTQKSESPTATKPVSTQPAKPKTITNSMTTAGGEAPDVDKMSKKDAIAFLSKKLVFRD